MLRSPSTTSDRVAGCSDVRPNQRFSPMNSSALLSGSHLRTYQAIFQHPLSHNLAWHDVHALFRHLGQIETESNGNLRVTRNAQTLILHTPRTKEVADAEDLMALRRFLERSEPGPITAVAKEKHWLVVIDHREARIYRSAEPGSVPQQIRPHVPEETVRHMHHPKDLARAQEKLAPASFFEPVAGVLNGAGKILIFGTGTGSSSEMEQFVAWLKETRPALAQRIVGVEVVDESHLTEAQLLAKARAFYANGGTN
jgi:hypothetical protein